MGVLLQEGLASSRLAQGKGHGAITLKGEELDPMGMSFPSRQRRVDLRETGRAGAGGKCPSQAGSAQVRVLIKHPPTVHCQTATIN